MKKKEQQDAFSKVVELAKAEFGEYKEELEGYEKGSYSGGGEIFWSEEVVPITELQANDDYGMPSDEDVRKRLQSNDQYYWYDGQQYVIAKRMRVVNRGWQLHLYDLIKQFAN